MGYVHDTQMAHFIDPRLFQQSAGVWSDSKTISNIFSLQRAAEAGSFVTKIPLMLPVNAVPMKGVLLKSLRLYYEIGGQELSALNLSLLRLTLPEDGAAFAAPESLSVQYDSTHASEAARLTVDQHSLTITLAQPAWMAAGQIVTGIVQITAGASSVLKYYGAQARYTLRL